MADTSIAYRAGYKYQLAQDYRCHTRCVPINSEKCETSFIALWDDGNMLIKSGYAWNGPSGPTLDTRTFMRPSLGHDAKFQLIRMGLVGREYIEVANDELQADCLADGMSRIRAWYVRRAMRFADPATRPSAEPVVVFAP